MAFLVSFVTTDFSYALVIILFVASLLQAMQKIGRGIVLREAIAFLYVITCLLMPMVGYEYFNQHNPISRLWVRYMMVPPETYFGYAVPAISAFCLALTFPFYKAGFPDEGELLNSSIDRAKGILKGDKFVGIIIILAGLGSFVLNSALPVSLQYISTILFISSFAGLLYVYFTPEMPKKKLLIGMFLLFLILNAISIGMFTVVVYMGITIFSFFYLNKRISIFRKVAVFAFLLVIFMAIQNTKYSYRLLVWERGYGGDRTALFSDLFVDNLMKGQGLFQGTALFSVYVRTNQGFNVALVMKRIPNSQAFDGGKALGTAIASSFVPRFLWPDKPEAGGHFNMKYYTGYAISNWSTNVGPLGEAYGAFGPTIGVFYMFLIGLFLRFTYSWILQISRKNPLFMFWIPVVFYQITYSAETDTLQILNSILKTAVMLWIIYKIFPRWFGIQEYRLMTGGVIKSA